MTPATAGGTRPPGYSLGRLVRVRATPGGTILATYTYDALDRLLLADRGAAGRLRFRYAGTTLALTGIVDDATGTVLRHVVPAPDGTVLADRNGAGTDPRVYGTNAHHDVTWVADGTTGAVIATARYDPWGTLLRSSGTLPAWRFQGSWHDSFTDLAYARARWYSSPLGAFISEDSLLGAPETPASRHLLAYAEGDPVKGWDPEGRANVGTRHCRGAVCTYATPWLHTRLVLLLYGVFAVRFDARIQWIGRQRKVPVGYWMTEQFTTFHAPAPMTVSVKYGVDVHGRYAGGWRGGRLDSVWVDRMGGGWVCQMCVFRPVRGTVAWSPTRLVGVRVEAFARYQPVGYEEPDIVNWRFEVSFR